MDNLDAQLSKLDLTPTSLLLVEVPVGNIPVDEIRELLAQVSIAIREVIPEHRNILCLPRRPDGDGPRVSAVELYPNSLLLVEIPVGNLSTAEIQGLLNDVAKSVRGMIPEHQDIWYLPRRPDGEGPKVEVIRGDADSVLVIKVPCGKLIGKERADYLADIRAHIQMPHGFKDIVVVPA